MRVVGRVGGRSGRLAALGAVAVVLVGLLTACDRSPVVLSGTVVTEPSAAGAGGVPIGVYDAESTELVAQTFTRSDGRYSFRSSVLDSGSYKIHVGERWWPDDAESWDEATVVELSAESPAVVDWSLAEIGSVAGTVVDDTGSGLGSVTVAVVRVRDRRSIGVAATDASGAFEVPVTETDPVWVLLIDQTGKWPVVAAGGLPPDEFLVTGGRLDIGFLDISERPARTELVSRSWFDGTAAGGSGQWPSLSADGRFVAFVAGGGKSLVREDANRLRDVFVHDRSTGTTTLASVSSEGGQGNGDALYVSLSADGRHVAFSSLASGLVSGDTNDQPDVFVHDRATGATSRVSVASDGSQANGATYRLMISADGRHVAFVSSATNLVPDDTNGAPDAFVHDRVTGATSRVSVGSDGREATGWEVAKTVVISADGRHVAFESDAAHVAGDTDGNDDVYVHDRVEGTTSLVSVSSDGAHSFGASTAPSISSDGRFVAFASDDPTLAFGDTNNAKDVFVHDRSNETTTRLTAPDGAEGTGDASNPFISADGRRVAFESDATNLVPGDTNGFADVFVHDLQAGSLARVSVAADGTQGTGWSWSGAINADGTYVAFTSRAALVAPEDPFVTNVDTFVHGPLP